MTQMAMSCFRLRPTARIAGDVSIESSWSKSSGGRCLPMRLFTTSMGTRPTTGQKTYLSNHALHTTESMVQGD